jgi:hypothetical protein
VGVEVDLLLPGNRPVKVDIGTVADLIGGERHIYAPVVSRNAGKGQRREQNPPPGEPASGVDDEVANPPLGIVEVEVLHVAEFAVDALEAVAQQFLCGSAHGSSFLVVHCLSFPGLTTATPQCRPGHS